MFVLFEDADGVVFVTAFHNDVVNVSQDVEIGVTLLVV
jgi:hypothetical protein